MSGIGVLVETNNKTEYAYKIKAPIGSLSNSVLDLDPLGVFIDTKEPTGFNRNLPVTMGVIELSTDGVNIYRISENGILTRRTDGKFATGTTYEIVASARQLAIFPVVGQTEFYVYVNGTKYIYTTLQLGTFANVSGISYAYFDSTGLHLDNPFTSRVFRDEALITTIYGNATTSEKIVFSDERHGIVMDGATHQYLHLTEGMRYISGLDLQGLVVNTSTYTATGAGIVLDQDISWNIPVQGNHPFWFIQGTVWTSINDTNLFGYKPSGAQVSYNLNTAGTWGLVNVASNNYMCVHFMVSNDREYPVVKILGQEVYANITSARDGVLSEIHNLYLNGLPSIEQLFIGSVIINGAGQLQSIDGTHLYVDLRSTTLTTTGGVSGSATIASNVLYDNTTSGLSSTNVQLAIDEISNKVTSHNVDGGAASTVYLALQKLDGGNANG